MGGLSGLDDLYESVVMDHYRNPRNSQPIENATATAKLYNPLCGDESKIEARINNDTIEALCLSGRGCAISQSSGSIMSELVEGKSLSVARQLAANVHKMFKSEELSEQELDELGDMEALSGVRRFPVRIKCALLPWTVLENAIEAD